jgi:hypothetical protein
MNAKIKKEQFGYSVLIDDYLIKINETTARLQNIHGNYTIFSEILHYLKNNFPLIKRIEFDDNSKLIINRKPKDQPSEKPFLLSYFFIAKYGKTWFEHKFGAKMKNREAYLQYREATSILQQPITINFSNFILNSQCTDEQAIILQRYFDPKLSWNDFFNIIPENLQYFSCFGWLNSFINSLIKNTYNMNDWYIDIVY